MTEAEAAASGHPASQAPKPMQPSPGLAEGSPIAARDGPAIQLLPSPAAQVTSPAADLSAGPAPSAAHEPEVSFRSLNDEESLPRMPGGPSQTPRQVESLLDAWRHQLLVADQAFYNPGTNVS